MKILFVYFGQKQICTNVQEAVEFINSLKECGRGAFLEVNAYTRELLKKMFAGKFCNGATIRTTGCGNTDIRAFNALGDTVAEHDAVFAARKRAEAAELKAARESAKLRRAEWMAQERNGMYVVTLEYPCLVGYYCRPAQKTFKRKVFATSGNDALAQVVNEFNTTPDGGYYETESVRFISK